MKPAREPIGAHVTLGLTVGIGAHPTTRNGLQLQSNETEDVIRIDLERRRDRESAAYRATGTLVRTGSEGMTPAGNARVNGAVGIEFRGPFAEEARIAVRGDDVENYERVLWDFAAGDLRVRLRAPFDLRRRRS